MAVKKNKQSVHEFISGGADVKTPKEVGFRSILIRMPNSILKEIDKRIEDKPWMNRTQWIMGCIDEKLRDEK